ncbi:hypothetical protein K435DRAFT_792016 [Dendrothele bispora CBS 962.96]|uniref:Uncharacterized protein n=1 Tax=Dendrothele bispora (strain CBS 962.96) TaxID=1314807 RepID=A0A4V4HHK8_DENBC|nr:hypothetical protein K435DRAFT_792016 [Dendrothele bispora CBS 962.96]
MVRALDCNCNFSRRDARLRTLRKGGNTVRTEKFPYGVDMRYWHSHLRKSRLVITSHHFIRPRNLLLLGNLLVLLVLLYPPKMLSISFYLVKVTLQLLVLQVNVGLLGSAVRLKKLLENFKSASRGKRKASPEPCHRVVVQKMSHTLHNTDINTGKIDSGWETEVAEAASNEESSDDTLQVMDYEELKGLEANVAAPIIPKNTWTRDVYIIFEKITNLGEMAMQAGRNNSWAK